MASRLEKLNLRRTDPLVANAQLMNEAYRKIAQSESVKYVVGAMQPIDPEYTKSTYAQARRVINQLGERLTVNCEYEYQGSVTNDTHIKAHSDIDVLAIIGKFYCLEAPQQPTNPYKGDPIQDLLDLREEASASLKKAFPEATVDASGSKSISVQGGSLRRKIDVVPSNWLNTNKYVETNQKIWRAVEVLDSNNRCKLKNTPFLHNAWISHKDSNTNGGLRKAARLLKSLKYDSEAIDLSSYDLVSIAFNIPGQELAVDRGMELSILNTCHTYCLNLLRDAEMRRSLSVPDGHRKIFAEGHATDAGLQQLCNELGALVNDVLTENRRSFSKLAEARVSY